MIGFPLEPILFPAIDPADLILPIDSFNSEAVDTAASCDESHQCIFLRET